MVRLEPLCFIGPDTEAQGGSVYPHDPGEMHLRKGSEEPKKILMATVCRHSPPKILFKINFKRIFKIIFTQNEVLLNEDGQKRLFLGVLIR